MTDDDHVELLEALRAHNGPVIISGYKSKLYDAELPGWYKATKKARTQTTAERQEILWMNFEPETQIAMPID